MIVFGFSSREIKTSRMSIPSMSTPSSQRVPAKPGSPVFAFLFLAVLAACFLAAGLVLGTEARMLIERTEERVFRITGSNHFSGYQFHVKTIDGVTGVVQDDALRERLGDSEYERWRQRRQKHLEFLGSNGMLRWTREKDQAMIEEFMRGKDASLGLAEKPPLWRMGAAWFMVVFGGLTFLGAIQSFFPKKTQRS